jgi:hypothetical protein
MAPTICGADSSSQQNECMLSFSADSLIAGKWRLAFRVLAQTLRLESCLHGVERLSSKGRGIPAQFIPIRFAPSNRISKNEKLLLAFDAFALSEMLGRDVPLGKIIHGDNYATPTAAGASSYGKNVVAFGRPFTTESHYDSTLCGMRVSDSVSTEGGGKR